MRLARVVTRTRSFLYARMRIFLRGNHQTGWRQNALQRPVFDQAGQSDHLLDSGAGMLGLVVTRRSGGIDSLR